MKRIDLFITAIVFLCVATSIPAFSLEILSNTSLDEISGKAVTDNPGFNFLPDVPAPVESNEQEMTTFSQGNTGIHKTVVVDFIGQDALDNFGNTYRESFNATVEAENVVYENFFEERPHDGPYNDYRDYFAKDTYSFVVFEGIIKGKAMVPEYYDNDPTMRSKTLAISRSRIDLPDGLTGNYLCSYQGHLFSPDDITEQDQTFLIYPNRQTITTGRAENGDMTILLPSGADENTVWKPFIKSIDPETQTIEYLVIPEGESYVHIALNHMVMRTDINFKIRLSHGKTPWTFDDDAHLPTDINQTLGSFVMTGGSTSISGGNVLITVNESL